MAIRFGNFGLESLDHIDGEPEGDDLTLIVDAPSGKGLFRADTNQAISPLESHRTLKTYRVPSGTPTHEIEKCGGGDWRYFVRYRSREGGKWRAMSAMLNFHSCSQGIQITVRLPDGKMREWVWERDDSLHQAAEKPSQVKQGKLLVFPLTPPKPGLPN
jgi:hypothetical protein